MLYLQNFKFDPEGDRNVIHHRDKDAEKLKGGSLTSMTSGSKKYEIKIGHANLTIIDTPSFCDSRGLEVDA